MSSADERAVQKLTEVHESIYKEIRELILLHTDGFNKEFDFRISRIRQNLRGVRLEIVETISEIYKGSLHAS